MVDHIPPLIDLNDEALAAVDGALAKPYSGGAHKHFEAARAELQLAKEWLEPPAPVGELFPPLGPPNHSTFEIMLSNLSDDTNHLGVKFHTFSFLRDMTMQEGWQFGDRNAYRCATLYVMRAGEIAARLVIQSPKQPDGGKAYIKINDRNGLEYQTQKGCPLSDPVYTTVEKPADLADHRVDFSKFSGVTASILLPATTPNNPNGWFLPTLDSPNKIIVSGYLGTGVGVVMTFERVGAELDMVLVGKDQPGW